MQAWDDFSQILIKELGKETVEKWIKTLRIVQFDACNLYLEANDAFQVIWFEEHVRKRAKKYLLNNNKKHIQIHLTCPTQVRKKKPKQNGQEEESLQMTFDEIEPLATFENFVDSPSNILPFKLLYKLTQYDTNSSGFNPIYVCGPEGSGKSHLLMATANVFKQNQANVLYVNAKTFTEHVIRAMRIGEMDAFRSAYRNVDILIVDDVHHFARKNATQEEFFHTFNTLHLSGTQIILSANVTPGELQYIEPRLASRFEWGIVLPLEASSSEHIEQILDRRAEALNSPIHPKVRALLATHFSRNAACATRALETLLLRHHIRQEKQKAIHSPITTSIARYLLDDLIKEETTAGLSPDKIAHQVAKHFGIRTEDLLGKSQQREFALARHIAMTLCRESLNLPYKQIGDFFSGRDHSTVMSAIKQIKGGLNAQDKGILSSYRSIVKNLK